MAVKALVKRSEYHDSVSLMLVARELGSLEDVKDAAVVMATEANKSILSNAGLLTAEIEAASSNDLVIAVSAVDATKAQQALENAEELLKRKASPEAAGEFRPKSIRSALSLNPGTNLVVISVAGRFAADEAREALEHGLHVLLFSDNVSLEDEIALKKFGRDHGLLLMGPGAGTAIINGVSLGFANALPSGPVGIVSAAGTGLQEVSTLLARRGVGISQGIGTGGRDLKKEVGGIMMLLALQALQQDPATEVIVLISKPPAEEVTRDVLKQASASRKPTIVCFLGGEMGSLGKASNVVAARYLQECSLLATGVVHPGINDIQALFKAEKDQLAKKAKRLKVKLGVQQRYLRGLFSGGTLCYEAQVIWKDMYVNSVHSNAPLPGGLVLPIQLKVSDTLQ